MTTPKRNEAVAFASASQLEALDKCRGDEHNGTVEVWMRATDTHDQPIYSAETVAALQGEVSRLRAGVRSAHDRLKYLSIKNGLKLDADLVSELAPLLTNLEPPTDGR